MSALADSWFTRGDIPVRRDQCAHDGCAERGSYRDPVTNDPLCGPHFRALGLHREGAPPSPPPPAVQADVAAPPSDPEVPMPPAGSRTRPTCSRPGCTRPHLAHGLCHACTSRRRQRGLPARVLTAEEMRLLDVPVKEVLRQRAKDGAEAPAVETPNVEDLLAEVKRLRVEVADADGFEQRIVAVNEELARAGVDPDDELTEAGAVRELVKQRDLAKEALTESQRAFAIATELAQTKHAEALAAVEKERDEAVLRAREVEETLKRSAGPEAMANHAAFVEDCMQQAAGRALALHLVLHASDRQAKLLQAWRPSERASTAHGRMVHHVVGAVLAAADLYASDLRAGDRADAQQSYAEVEAMLEALDRAVDGMGEDEALDQTGTSR